MLLTARALILMVLVMAAAPGQFVDASTTAGISIPGNPQVALGRGPCFADFDGDGDQDLVVPQGPGLTTKFFRNNGDGTFTDFTSPAGLAAASGRTKACIAADVDNDGDQDFYLCRNWLPNQLWINDGSGFFTESAGLAGVDHAGGSYTASFGDYDRDGDLDLYVGNYTASFAAAVPEPNILYRNDGNGTFTDVTTFAGVGQNGLCFTGVWFDYNEDGWPDLFIGNDRGFVPTLDPDTTYRNNGDGTFTDVGATLGTNLAIGAMGSDFTDVFNDGGWDVFVSNVQTGHVFHEWAPSSGTYPNTAATYGIEAFQEGWGCSFVELDNDGRQDLYIVHTGTPNHLYLNNGSAVWTEVGAAYGAAIGSIGYSLAVVDYDDDGRMDLFMTRPYAPSVLLRNTSQSGGNWLKLKLEGTVSNRDGLGATVSVTTGVTTQRQMVRSGTSYLASSDKRAHFGLGTATQASRVVIRWPSGQVQELRNVAGNQSITVREPSLTLAGVPQVGAVSPLVASFPGEAGLGFVTALAGSAVFGIPLGDGRIIPLDPDPLFYYVLTTSPNPLLAGNVAVLDASGTGTATLSIPPIPSLVGVSFEASSISVDATFFAGVRTILPALSITIQ